MVKSSMCLIDQENLKCWGEDDYGRPRIGDADFMQSVPNITPTMVSTGSWKTCFLIEKEAYCVGRNKDLHEIGFWRKIDHLSSLIKESKQNYEVFKAYTKYATKEFSLKKEIPEISRKSFSKEYSDWYLSLDEEIREYTDITGRFIEALNEFQRYLTKTTNLISSQEIVEYTNHLIAKYNEKEETEKIPLLKSFKKDDIFEFSLFNFIQSNNSAHYYLRPKLEVYHGLYKIMEEGIKKHEDYFSRCLEYHPSKGSIDELKLVFNKFLVSYEDINDGEVGDCIWDFVHRSNDDYEYQTPNYKLNLENVSFVTTKGDNVCAISNNEIKCLDSLGELSVPKSFQNPKMVAMGKRHSCAIDDSGVQCWGDNSNGELNIPPLKNPYYIDTQRFHTCALDQEGVKCWGYPGHGRTKVPSHVINPQIVSVGGRHTCVIDKKTSGNEVVCWGSNSYGQSNVPEQLHNPYHVIAKDNKTCALDQHGLLCWGEGTQFEASEYSYNTNLCLDENKSRSECNKENVFGDLSSYTYQDEYYNPVFNYCEFKTACLNEYCQTKSCKENFEPVSEFLLEKYNKEILQSLAPFGQAPLVEEYDPIIKKYVGSKEMKLLIELSSQISIGSRHHCIITEEGLYCDGNAIASPFLDSKRVENKIVKVASGQSEICALDSTNTLFCWGDYEQHTIEDVKDFDVGAEEVCVIKTDGRAKCHNDFIHQVVRYNREIKNAQQIVTGHSHACVIDENKVKCWGKNDEGQLDIPTNIKNPYFLSTARNHTCALAENGLFCWGSNNYGQATVPLDLKDKNINFLSVGSWHTCVHIVDEGSKCWGYDRYKQSSIPNNLKENLIFSGHKKSCALTKQGLSCWEKEDDQEKVSQYKIPHLIDYDKKKECEVVVSHSYYDEHQLQCTILNDTDDSKVETISEFGCLFNSEGSRCGITKNEINSDFEKLYTNLISLLGSNEEIFEKLIAGSYRAERDFLNKIKILWEKSKTNNHNLNNAIDQYVLKLLAVFVKQNNSKYFQEEVIPHYNYLSEGLSDFSKEDAPHFIKFKLRTIQQTLQLSKTFLDEEQVYDIEQIINSLTGVYKEPTQNNLSNFKITLADHRYLLEGFEHSPRLNFLIQLFDITREEL